MATLVNKDGLSQGKVPDEWVDELMAQGFVEELPDGRIVITQAGRDHVRLTTRPAQ